MGGQAMKRFWKAALIALGLLAAGGSGASAEVYRPASETQTDLTNITVPYATNGRTRTWAYTWSTTGQLLTVDGPLAGTDDTTTYTYNADGFLETVTNPLGHVTTVTTWNARGQPTAIVDANSVTTNLTYDYADRVLTMTVDPGTDESEYAFEYDAVGNLTKITQPEGGWLAYDYDDASRLTEISNNRGETQTFTVNLMGDPTAMTVRTSGSTITRQQSWVYDEIGRVIQAIGAGSQTTGFTYDKVGNLKTVTDARGKVFQASYDALDRVVSQTNPQSQAVQAGYSANDALNSHKDGRLLETTRVIDGFGQVIREVSPDRGTITYWYDEAGNLTQVVDGDGQQTNYTYDDGSRLTQATFAGASAETITYSYDATAGGNMGIGRLTGITEESGSSAFVYDAQGRLTGDTKVIQGRTYAVGYAYDRNGEVTEITLPSGRTVTFTRASDGLVSGITTKADPLASSETLASSVGYLPFGPLQSLTYGNGLTLTRTFDQNYWLERIEVKAIGVTSLDLTFGRNANGQLTGVTDNASSGRGASFTYTDAGRLATATGAWGDDAYTYDAAGNRTGKARDIGGTVTEENLVLASTSNRVNSTEDASTATLRTLTWRASGDLSQAAFAGGSTYEYHYNARKRLSVVEKDSVDAAWYGYDHAGRRVWRSVFGATTVQTHYVFDPAGHLIAEHDGATGDVVREYVWLDDIPVAMIDSSSGTAQTYFIHTGQIEEPLVVTDASKAKVWDGYVEPYGQAQVFGTPSAGLDLRLPGQWEQAETGGLFQNWHREYDPSLGRYIEADPLGIGAGQNVYAYVGGRPLEYTDPTGEYGQVIAGAAIGGVLDFAIQAYENDGNLACIDWWRVARSAAIGGALSLVPQLAGPLLGGVGGRLLGGVGARMGSKSRILFGQKRIGPNFGVEGRPAHLAGRSISDVANDLRSGALHPDQLPIDVFKVGDKIVAANNRSLAALSEAGLSPTKTTVIQPTASLLRRLREAPILSNATLPSSKIAVTPSQSNLTVLRVIELAK